MLHTIQYGKGAIMKDHRWINILLCVIIAAVALIMLIGYVSSMISGANSFWIGPIPLFQDALGLWISNLDVTSLGIPICGICLMLLYIDVKRRTND